MENDTFVVKNVSYLRARDPSILSFNRPRLACNLLEDFGETTEIPLQQKQQQDENICVYLRIKNGHKFQDLYEVKGNALTSKIPPGSVLMRNIRDGESMRKIYTFTKIFTPETTQRDLFNDVVKPKILDFINGQNSTLLTYGASGSGKTFTVIGTDKEPGVVPRSLEYLFRTLPKLSRNPKAKPSAEGNVTALNEHECRKEKLLCRSLLNSSSSSMEHHLKIYKAMQQRLSTEPVAELDKQEDIAVGVWVSFAEIYNEHIYDLLQLDPPRGKQRPKLRLGMSNGNGHTYIKNLTSVSVTSGKEAYQILQFGLHNLNYAATQLNEHSSRSHSIFTIKLVQLNKVDGGSCVSCFNFCDLAGSERLKKTNNVGERLKESNNINSSLLVLGRCISAVRDSQKHDDHKLVPFRESKLTQLFQKALAGAEDIAMIVNINPSRDIFDETQHVLNFSSIAKSLIIDRKPEPVVPKHKNRFSQLVEQDSEDDFFDGYTIDDYKRALALLREELETQKHEYEIELRMNFDYVQEEYSKELKKKEDYVAAKVKRSEELIRTQYEAKLVNMRLKYERIIEELQQNSAVIEIDSSDEEENAGDVNDKLSALGKAALQEVVAEGIDGYKQLSRKYEAIEKECLALRARNIELENELDMYKKFRRPQNTTSESDDDSEHYRDYTNANTLQIEDDTNANTLQTTEDESDAVPADVEDASELL